jgi:hypothetical protein
MILLFLTSYPFPNSLVFEKEQSLACSQPFCRQVDPGLPPEVPTQRVKDQIHCEERLPGQPEYVDPEAINFLP